MSGPALEDGIEWTVKLSEVEAPHVVERFRGAFDSLWWDEEFLLFTPGDEAMRRRVEEALDFARRRPGQPESLAPVFFDLQPHPYQQATLDQLESEREDRGCFRNLVVAPTGTGKTLIAAFDYKRQPHSGIYLALARFDRRPNFGQLPRVLQQDVKVFFKTYQQACSQADEILFSLGHRGVVDSACSQSSLGKLTPSALYVHVSALEALAPVLRAYEGCARGYLGHVEGANIVKLHRGDPLARLAQGCDAADVVHRIDPHARPEVGRELARKLDLPSLRVPPDRVGVRGQGQERMPVCL